MIQLLPKAWSLGNLGSTLIVFRNQLVPLTEQSVRQNVGTSLHESPLFSIVQSGYIFVNIKIIVVLEFSSVGFPQISKALTASEHLT